MHYSPDAARTVGRFLKALAISGNNRPGAAAFAASQGWDDAEIITRAAVGGLEASGTNGLRNFLELDFLGLAWPAVAAGQDDDGPAHDLYPRRLAADRPTRGALDR